MQRASTISLARGSARRPTAETADGISSRRVANVTSRVNTPGLLQNHPYRRGKTKVKKSISTSIIYSVFKREPVTHSTLSFVCMCDVYNQQATFPKSLAPFPRLSEKRRPRSSLPGPVLSSS